DSTYALPLIWAAWAHSGTALDQCDSTASIASRLRGMRLTRLEQMQIDRVMARCHGDLPTAYALGRALTEAVPRSELMWEQLAPDPIRLPAPVMREIALDLAAHGDSVAGRLALARTLAWHASRPGAEQAQEAMRFERAEAYYAAGYADSARAIAADLARAHPKNEQYAGLLGVLAAQRGDRAEAARLDRLLVGLERPLGRGQAGYW